MLAAYAGNDRKESRETLVTSVTRMDAKGWLSSSSPLGKLFNPFTSLFSLRWRGFAHPLIQHAEILRQQVRGHATPAAVPQLSHSVGLEAFGMAG